MATPKPGEIRCPTCHRSTPPASFCTQCGSAIPPDARIRPRGMDRDELQDRIRARRSGGDPYRRGEMSDDDRGGYERYEPDPTDTQARRPDAGQQPRRDYFDEDAPAAGSAGAALGDITRDRDEWARPAAAPTPAAAPPPSDEWAPPPSDVPVADAYEPEYVDNFDDAAYDQGGYGYAYEEWQEPRQRRSGLGAVAILGFLALAVLALLSGAVLAGIFSGGPQAGQLDATPTSTATPVATEEPTPPPTADHSSPGASGSPTESGNPSTFPDGFTAAAEPCLPGSAGLDGCDSNGTVNSGAVDVWVGFENGTSDDVIGATLVAPDGSTVDGSIDLDDIGCGDSCDGYTRFPFSGLSPGDYEVRITRNGEPAAETTFEVTD
jgi:hypothetical protein